MKSKGHEGTIYKIDKALDRLADIMSKLTIAPALAALVVWMFVFTVTITGRYMFSVTWIFVEEFTQYWLVLIGSFTLAYTLKSGGHVRIDTVLRLLPKKIVSAVEIVTSLIALIVTVYLIVKGVDWFWYGLSRGVHSVDPSNVLVWPVYLLVPLGLGSMLPELLLRFYRGVINWPMERNES